MRRNLPAQFKDLESFSDWAIATESGRNQKRTQSDMAELTAFAEAMRAHARDVLQYLCQFKLDELPDEARALQLMTLSFAEIGPAVEIFHQPTVPDAMDFARFVPFPESDGLNH